MDEARKLQERLEQNRVAVAAEVQRSRSTSFAELAGAVRLENVDSTCSLCGVPVTVTALARARLRDGANPEALTEDDVVWERRPLPALCEGCAASEESAAVVAPSAPKLSTLDWLALRGVNTRKHGHATLANFDASDAPRAPLEARRFADDTIVAGPHDRVQGLYLVSPNFGTGKSHLAVAIMREVHEARPDLSVLYEPADRLVVRVQDSYGKGITDALIDERARAGLYVLDDLGREKATADALRVLGAVLEEREGAPTCITSNGLPHQLGARYTDEVTWGRVESRLGDGVYRFVAVDGRDRRFNLKAARMA